MLSDDLGHRLLNANPACESASPHRTKDLSFESPRSRRDISHMQVVTSQSGSNRRWIWKNSVYEEDRAELLEARVGIEPCRDVDGA